MVGNLQCLAHVLFDQEDRQPLRVDLAQRAEDALHDDRRQTHRRLVKQQQARPGQQRAADREHLLLAARQVAGQAADALVQAREQRQHPLEIAGDGSAAGPVSRPAVGTELQVLAHRQGRQDGAAFCDLHQAAFDDLVRLQPGQIFALEAHPAGLRFDQARQRQQGRRFARSVRTDEGANLAGVDLEADALHGLDVTVGDLQVGDC